MRAVDNGASSAPSDNAVQNRGKRLILQWWHWHGMAQQ